MRSRAALLPHPADPFLFKYWLKFYQNVWRDEVDRLYILVNSPIEKNVIDFMEGLVKDDPSIEFHYIDRQIEHGQALDLLLAHCKEDLVMLVEDDGFIFKKGMVDEAFSYIERDEVDIVGSPRGSCSQEIWDVAKTRWGLNYDGYGDVGPNFWPCFFFTKKQILIDTDRNFGAKAWNRGERIEALDYEVVSEVLASDTFVNTSLQLRNKGYRIKTIPQYHGSPYDLEHFELQNNLFDGKAGWVHVGSLSSGVHGVLVDNQGRALGKRLITEAKGDDIIQGQCSNDQEKLEWERRVAFWMLFYENSDGTDIPFFRSLYHLAIERVIRQFGLGKKNILRRMNVYRTIGL